jgi:(1->4)-alpha-D-glucan 1-alpha-D-glucosylmutase
MASLRLPIAAYRLQFNQEFTFHQARELVDYLHTLGIGDVHASPLLQSRRGSGHGYDVTDPTRLDPDPGTEGEFEAFQTELQRRGMGLILDIVPNHMAAGKENSWWMDVLENGPASAYAGHFDIDWHPPSRALDNRVLLPVLGDAYGRVLENQELQPVYGGHNFRVEYYQEAFPLAPRSYRHILRHRLDVLEKRLGRDAAACQEYHGILAGLDALPEPESLPAEAAGQRRLQANAVKERLQRLYESEPAVRKFVNENLRLFRGKKREPASFCLLDRLLAEQRYVLAFWQNPNESINYRRFFTITDLVGVRVEDPLVFEATHGVIFRLVEKGLVTGLRIDHVDGLRDPLGYLQRLQERVGRSGNGGPPGFYVIVEKILEASESLPAEWPVYGTTGYDFLGAVTRLFVHPSGAADIVRIYDRFLDKRMACEEVLLQKKKLVMATILAVEMRSLARQLGRLAEQDRYARDLPRADLAQALIETTACLGVYRTYIRGLEVPRQARECIDRAVALARQRRPSLNPACFAFVREALLLQDGPHLLPEQREARLAFAMRWQQFTGPIVAKGLEDTTLYVYNPLISLNEVGSDPTPTAPSDFHGFIQKRARRWPYSFNTTATHDTKRAEDVRARISVLSEMPAAWRRHLNYWRRLNAGKKKLVNGGCVPDPNEEIFLYQTLLGAWPLNAGDLHGFRGRLQAYMVKATREAMVHTRWTRPNLEHERALTDFVDSLLDRKRSRRFLDDFLRFHQRVAYYGMLNSLAQTLLKITCPGVPDFYQGSELWDFRLVDPDNRGPVDFRSRAALLRSLEKSEAGPSQRFVQDLLAGWSDGGIKLYVIWKALNFRVRNPHLFLDGSYQPLEARGERRQNVLAFIRSAGGRSALVGVPRWLALTKAPREPARIRRYWGASHLVLPTKAPLDWVDVLTGTRISCQRRQGRPALPLRKLFGNFPVALLSDNTAGPNGG